MLKLFKFFFKYKIRNPIDYFYFLLFKLLKQNPEKKKWKTWEIQKKIRGKKKVKWISYGLLRLFLQHNFPAHGCACDFVGRTT